MLRLLGEFEEAEQRVEELQIEHHVKTSVGYRYCHVSQEVRAHSCENYVSYTCKHKVPRCHKHPACSHMFIPSGGFCHPGYAL